jgi:hypothetical protein
MAAIVNAPGINPSAATTRTAADGELAAIAGRPSWYQTRLDKLVATVERDSPRNQSLA